MTNLWLRLRSANNQFVAEKVANKIIAYGIHTGFGSNIGTLVLEQKKAQELQKNLLVSLQ